MRCAVCSLDTGIVQNIIMANPNTDPAPGGTQLVRIGYSRVDAGWTYMAGAFSHLDTVSANDLTQAMATEDADPPGAALA